MGKKSKMIILPMNFYLSMKINKITGRNSYFMATAYHSFWFNCITSFIDALLYETSVNEMSNINVERNIR